MAITFLLKDYSLLGVAYESTPCTPSLPSLFEPQTYTSPNSPKASV